MLSLLIWISTSYAAVKVEDAGSARHLVWATNDPSRVESIGRSGRLDCQVASVSLIDADHANTFRTVGFILDPDSVTIGAAAPYDLVGRDPSDSDEAYMNWDRLLADTTRAPARSALDWNELIVGAKHHARGIRVTGIFMRVDSLMTPICGVKLERAVEEVRRRTGWTVVNLGPSQGHYTLAVARRPSATVDEPDTLQIFATRVQFERLRADARAAGVRIDGVWPSSAPHTVHTTAGYFEGAAFVAEWRSDFDGEVNISQRFTRSCQRLLNGETP